MTTPARPANVPEAATWNARENEWELGEKQDGRMVGEWRWWRPDGSLCCHSRFSEGQLHGPFQRFHRDGTVSRAGEFTHGRSTGVTVFTTADDTDEYFPDSDPIWRVEQDHDAGETRRFLRDGRPCNSSGVPLDEAFQDDLFTAGPEAFLASGLEAFLGEPVEAEPHAGIDDFEAVWGRPMPPDLARVAEILRSRGWPDLREWRTEFGSLPLPEDDANLAEWIILRDQQAYLGTGLTELAAGTVCVGSLGNGDTWHLSLYDDLTGLEQPQVHVFDHETATLDPPPAKTLADLALMCCLHEAADEQLSPEGVAATWRTLEGRVSPTWHFEAFQGTDLGDEARYRAEQQVARYLAYRARWIIYLLRNDGVVKVRDCGDLFDADLNPAIDEEGRVRRVDAVRDLVPGAFYALFRGWLFDDPQLPELLAAAAESRSRLVRDLGRLVAELAEGREQLGTIEDMQALKARWQALDLDPARAEARAAEQAAAAEAASAGTERKRALVAEAPDLEALAWSGLDDPELLDLVLERWREQGELAGELAALDRRFGAGGYTRENLSMSHEREEDELYLAERADPKLLPVLLGWTAAGKGQFEALLARMGDARAEPILRARLDVQDDYHHNRTRALLALTRMGRLDGLRPRIEGWLSSERLDADVTASIVNGDLVNACVDALGALGDAAAVPALQGLLAEESREYTKIRPRVAVALWRLGHDAGVPVLRELDEGERLATLAPHALDAVAVDLEAEIRQALDRPRYSRDDTIANRIAALRALAVADLPVELAAPWVHTYHHAVREAALAVFAARAVEPPPVRLLFKADVAAMSDDDVVGALADPHLVLGYNLAVHLAGSPAPSTAPALADFVRRRAADPRRWATGDDSDYDLYWAVWALSKLDVPEGNAAMNELLMADRKGPWWPVMKHPGTGPELIPGMRRMQERGLAWMRSTAQGWLAEHA